MQDIFAFEQTGVSTNGQAYGQFVATGIRPTFLERLKAAGTPVDPAIFERQVLAMDEVA
jgi:pilus assembly protein CpaF